MALKPVIDTSATLGKDLLLVDINKRYVKEKNEKGEYQNTAEFYMAYSVVALQKKFEKIEVKIQEKTAMFPLDENGKAIGIPDDCYVEFTNLQITPYVSKGWVQLSAKADKCNKKNTKGVNLKGE